MSNRIENRKGSMTMADLEAIHDMERNSMNRACASEGVGASMEAAKYHEHSEIFEEICHEAETEDQMEQSLNLSRQPRRGSLTGGCIDAHDAAVAHGLVHEPVEIRSLHRRRHSNYNPRNRAAHRQSHTDLEEHLRHLEDKHHLRRASFVNNLLEFSLSYDVSMSGSEHELSPALNFSCPVLSYMNDEEEDSVELRMLRRSSLVSVPEDSNQESWESLKDDGETSLPQDAHEMSREYVIELPPLEEYVKPSGKRRRSHSYKMLEERLTSESPIDVIKSFSMKDMAASISLVTLPTTAVVQSKDLDLQVQNTFQAERGQPLAARQQCARGA